MSIIYAFVIFCLFTGTSSYSPYWKPLETYKSCTSLKTIAEFNQARYMGTWHILREYGKHNSVFPSQCLAEEWTTGQNEELSIVKSFFLLERNGKKTEMKSNGSRLNPFKPELFNIFNTLTNYSILETDYDSYSLRHLCYTFSVEIDETNYGSIQILTRERNPPIAVIEKVEELIKKHGFDTTKYIEVNQTDCELLKRKELLCKTVTNVANDLTPVGGIVELVKELILPGSYCC